MNTIPETLKVWVEWAEGVDLPETIDMPAMDDEAVPDYLRTEYGAFKHWDHVEECGDCGHVATKTMWDKGKVDCCHHCSGCDQYKPYGEHWALEAKWGSDSEGDLCPECVDYYLKCAHCNSRGVDTKNAEGDWIHSDCA